jgi:hypothetical protein
VRFFLLHAYILHTLATFITFNRSIIALLLVAIFFLGGRVDGLLLVCCQQ